MSESGAGPSDGPGRALSREDAVAVLRVAPAPLLVLTPALVVVEASDAYLEATGRAREELLGRHVFDVFPDNPGLAGADGVNKLRVSLLRALETRRPDTMPVQRYDVTDDTGAFRPRWWSPVNVPVLDAHGEVRLLLHRVADVTEVVQLREGTEHDAPARDALRTRLREAEAELLARNRELAGTNEQLRELHRREQARAVTLAGFAEAMQLSLLTAPPQPAGLQVVARYRPAGAEAQVGGDWFDAFPVTAGQTAVVVGDVTGHDQAAAAAMAQLRSMLRGLAVTTGERPAVVLSMLDRAVLSLDVGATATVLLAVVGEADGSRSPAGTRRLRWSNAGHPPPVLLTPGQPASLLSRPPDLLIGVAGDTARHDHAVDLPAGATLVLYTDGLVERRGEDLGAALGRLVAAADAVRRLPLDEMCDHLITAMAPTGEDDVALIAVRVDDIR